MSFEACRWIWMNGETVPWENATFHVSAHALHYGTGVFEGIRCYETPAGPAIFRLDAHLDRLFNSAAIYAMPIPYTPAQLGEAIRELIRRGEYGACYIRPICFRGSASLHLNPRKCPVEVAILAWPWGRYLAGSDESKGVRVSVSPWRKFHSQMIPATAKASGQYVNSVLATSEAERRGFDEGLLLNDDGSIAEGAGENVFVVAGGRLLTNDERASILLGITRDAVLKVAKDMGYPVEVRTLTLDDLLSADEAFFTGTATEIAAISEVDGKHIGDSVPGPITRAIQAKFHAITSGRDPHYSHWMSPLSLSRAVEGAP